MAEKTVYGFQIRTKSLYELKEKIAGLEGLAATANINPDEWAVLFWTENDAKIARNLCESWGAEVWNGVSAGTIDEVYLSKS